MPRQQINSLTGIRGIAALSVVLYHYAGGFLPAINPDAYTGLIAKGYLWVDMFFLLSGFVMAHVYGAVFDHQVRPKAYFHFMLLRFARIYPLHLFILCALVGLELSRLYLVHAGITQFDNPPFGVTHSISALFLNLTMLHAINALNSGLSWNGPAWSIGSEWICYLFFPFIAILFVGANKWVRGLIAGLLIAGLLSISKGGINIDVTYDYGLWRCAFEFIGGMIIHAVFTSGFGRNWIGRDTVCLAIFGLILLGLHLAWPDLITVALFAVLILALAFNDGRAERAASHPVLMFLGKISYAVYMSHMLVISVLDTASKAATGKLFGAHFGPESSITVLILLVAFVLALATGLYHTIEEPARHAIRQSRLGQWSRPPRKADTARSPRTRGKTDRNQSGARHVA
jgi:peptidoglycan/LPS O-acetylase OafA/YrhL